jgi:hypothetical protein
MATDVLKLLKELKANTLSEDDFIRELENVLCEDEEEEEVVD